MLSGTSPFIWGANRVIESWPPRIMVQPIRNGQRSDVAGVARVFN
jgi:hypothetical protein